MESRRMGLLRVLLSLAFLLPQGILAAAPFAVETDPYLEQQWALHMIGAPEAWTSATGEGAVVAVLDTGIDRRHPDLRANVVDGARDFFNEQRTYPRDSSGHGTHVAGIIGAARNTVGTVGVAPRAGILPIRVCSANSCPSASIVRGIRYATRKGADVINLSLGTGMLGEVDGNNTAVREAVADAIDKGVVVVAAAGNSFSPLCHREPAASALCVGAVDRTKSKALYSNFDAGMISTYLVAPGGGDSPSCDGYVLSTFPRRLDNVCADKGYEAISGTSMAAPHVAGVAALLVSMGLEGQDIVRRILDSAEDIGAPGHDPIYGYGLVDAASAVAHPIP